MRPPYTTNCFYLFLNRRHEPRLNYICLSLVINLCVLMLKLTRLAWRLLPASQLEPDYAPMSEDKLDIDSKGSL